MCMSKSLLIVILPTIFAALPIKAATTTIDLTTTYQIIESLGGTTEFYAGWIYDHPYKQEIYTNSLEFATYDAISNANLILTIDQVS